MPQGLASTNARAWFAGHRALAPLNSHGPQRGYVKAAGLWTTEYQSPFEHAAEARLDCSSTPELLGLGTPVQRQLLGRGGELSRALGLAFYSQGRAGGRSVESSLHLPEIVCPWEIEDSCG